MLFMTHISVSWYAVMYHNAEKPLYNRNEVQKCKIEYNYEFENSADVFISIKNVLLLLD